MRWKGSHELGRKNVRLPVQGCGRLLAAEESSRALGRTPEIGKGGYGMSEQGWYYLHVNGDLIYKRDLGGTAADIRESGFARALWPMDPSDREGAWRICVEGLAAGATPERIKELAAKWGCDDGDADQYAARVGIAVSRDGDMWSASAGNFTNLAESPCGFGKTKLEAFADLAKRLGYKPSKMWGITFHDLLDQNREVAQGG